jgi:hypothetical protein
MWGNEITDPDAKLPPGCSFKRSKLETDEEGRLTRTFYDESGNVIHVVKGRRPHFRTGISVSYNEDPREYARIYYRNVRRHRDGHKPRLPDI